MARRRLLADAFWAGMYALPSEEREVVRHCTLTPDDLTLVAAKRSPQNRLGYALLLLALRHPGRALEPGEVPPAPMVAYVARQVGADPAALGTPPPPAADAARATRRADAPRRVPVLRPRRGAGGGRLAHLSRRFAPRAGRTRRPPSSRRCVAGGSCCRRRACWSG